MKEFKVPPICNGTVIDHIPAGQALHILQELGIPRPHSSSTVSVAMNVPTKSAAKLKDIIKVEDRELDSGELERLAQLAPGATVNVIRNYELAKKQRIAAGAMATR